MGGCIYGGFASRRSNLLTIARPHEPVSLNPLYLQGEDAEDIGALGYSYLTSYDSHDAIIADAAAVVPTIANGGISRDREGIVYHMRRDIKWQDGYPLTARDVIFTYHAIMNPSNAIPSRAGYDQIKKIWARDAYTVVVELTHPQANFVTIFFGGDGDNYPILPAHLLAAYPSLNHVAFNELPIGSGPYRFTKWIRGERLDLTANERYYGTKPSIRHLSIRFVHDPSTIVNELLTHEADATFYESPSKIIALRSIPNHRVVATLLPAFGAIVFNLKDPVMKDLITRRALSSAIDRRTLVKKAIFGVYDPDTGLRGLFSWAFDPGAGTTFYNLVGAKALLAKAGWGPGNDGIRAKDGRRLEMQFVFWGQSPIASEVVPLIMDEARAAGIDVLPRAYDFDQLYSPDGPLYRGKFQVALLGLGGGVDPDPAAYVACHQRSPNGSNFAQYCNEDVDRAVRQGVLVYDRAERRRIYSAIQRRIIRDVPYYFLWQSSEIDVIPSAMRGYEPSAISPYTSVAHWQLQH